MMRIANLSAKRNMKTGSFILFLAFVTFCMALPTHAADGKLLATSGLSQIEGSGGGGLVPWAALSGYDSQDEISLSVALSQTDLEDYRLNVQSISASFYDTVEVSLSQQRFDLKTLGAEIKQNILGAKYKILGDTVYGSYPQLSIGVQHKRNEDTAIPIALGATDTSGTDFYIAATRIHLGAIAGYNVVWNITTRATKANELGLLGFGGANNDSYKIMLEASAGVLLSRNLVVGMEYRQKPDNLGLGEDDWYDVFVSYIPSKSASFTLAWTELGSIAGAPKQKGLYLSINAHL